MIQDIEPYKYDNTFYQKEPNDDDFILIFENDKVILKKYSDNIQIPRYSDIKEDISGGEIIYLFSIEGNNFFLGLSNKVSAKSELIKESTQFFRMMKPKWMAFAGFTGYHLYNFYDRNRYCGRCGANMRKSSKERAMVCDSCNNIKYPQISPGIIVGIIDGDRILMTKYAKGVYKKYALVAGFNEIGETLEDTVRREVMEEVGLKVKNIRYYKNQPWGLSSSLLVGFFAELDGQATVTLDTNELSEATWFKREDIREHNLSISLTQEMIEVFRRGKI